MSEIVIVEDTNCMPFFSILSFIALLMILAICYLLKGPRLSRRTSVMIPLISLVPFAEAAFFTCETAIGSFQVIIAILVCFLIFLLYLRFKRRRLQIVVLAMTSLLPTAEAKETTHDIPYLWTVPLIFFIFYTLAAYELMPGCEPTSEMKHKLDFVYKRNLFKKQFDNGIFQNINNDTVYHESLRLWRAENRSRRIRNYSQYPKIFSKGLSALDFFIEEEKPQEEIQQQPEKPTKNLVDQPFKVNIAKPLNSDNPFFLLAAAANSVKKFNEVKIVRDLQKTMQQLVQADFSELTEWKEQYHLNTSSLKSRCTPKTTFPAPTKEEKITFQAIQHLNKLRASRSASSSSSEEEIEPLRYSKFKIHSLHPQAKTQNKPDLLEPMAYTPSTIEDEDKLLDEMLFQDIANTSQENLKLPNERNQQPNVGKNLLNEIKPYHSTREEDSIFTSIIKNIPNLLLEAAEKSDTDTQSSSSYSSFQSFSNTSNNQHYLAQVPVHQPKEPIKHPKVKIKAPKEQKTLSSTNQLLNSRNRKKERNSKPANSQIKQPKKTCTIKSYRKVTHKPSPPDFVKQAWKGSTFQYMDQ